MRNESVGKLVGVGSADRMKLHKRISIRLEALNRDDR
jgi:hypothetical protein